MKRNLLKVAEEADAFFMNRSPIHETMQRLARLLTEINIPFANLPTLIELKLASGMTAEHWPRDLDDVIQLIRANQLKIDFSDKLNPYVHDKFKQLWRAAQHEEDY